MTYVTKKFVDTFGSWKKHVSLGRFLCKKITKKSFQALIMRAKCNKCKESVSLENTDHEETLHCRQCEIKINKDKGNV